VNRDELAALCARVATEQPGEIRLRCPRGHFIIAVKLAARLRAESDNSDPALTMWPAVGRHQVRGPCTHWVKIPASKHLRCWDADRMSLNCSYASRSRLGWNPANHGGMGCAAPVFGVPACLLAAPDAVRGNGFRASDLQRRQRISATARSVTQPRKMKRFSAIQRDSTRLEELWPLNVPLRHLGLGRRVGACSMRCCPSSASMSTNWSC